MTSDSPRGVDPPVRTRHPIEVYRNAFTTVHDDDVEWADGRRGHHLRIGAVDAPPGVVVVPTHEDRIGLVRTYRYPLAAWQWGLPRGFAQSADPLVTAANELSEEMGLVGDLTTLGHFSPDSGLLAGRVVVVHAAVADPTTSVRDTDEVTATAWLDLPTLADRLGSGEYDDGMTMAALTLARARGLLPGAQRW